MDNFMRLTDKDMKEQNHKEKISFHPHITSERIEKLKKSFQPFWMRGMMPLDKENEVVLNPKNVLNQL